MNVLDNLTSNGHWSTYSDNFMLSLILLLWQSTNSDIVDDTTQAVHALREHDMPIMLLSQEFDGNDALDQIHLFKQVNKRVKIILLADTDSVSYLRKARSAGIFYHALEPKTDEDMQELTMALESAREACEEQERSLLGKIARAIPTPG